MTKVDYPKTALMTLLPLVIFLSCASPNTRQNETDPAIDPKNAIPVPFASADSEVTVNELIHLKGTASDLFGGTIVKWEWDAGNTGTFIETTPDSTFTVSAPSAINSKYPCVLRVTDNDSNVAADTVYVNVLSGSEIVGIAVYADSNGTGIAVVDPETQPVVLCGGKVFIHPRLFLADTGFAQEKHNTLTDQNGYFRIFNVLSGEHMIYIRDNSGKAVAHIVTIPDKPQVTDVGVLYARQTSAVQIGYEDSTPGDVLFFIDVQGTALQLRCTSRNLQVTLDKIPTGVNHIITVRIFRPIVPRYYSIPVNLKPGEIEMLEPITG